MSITMLACLLLTCMQVLPQTPPVPVRAAPSALSAGIGDVQGTPLDPPPTPPDDRPNLVLIVADDMGVDMIGCYAEGVAPPCTPNLDALAAQGLSFRNAWTNPICSSTRATLLTGRYSFRTGIGNVCTPFTPGLALRETLLPELLEGYASTAVGKWHLGGDGGPLHPNASGFGRFAGDLTGLLHDYQHWQKTVDGVARTSTVYATTDTTDEAIAALQTMPRPWFLYVAYNAPHDPFHVPPRDLCTAPACPGSFCESVTWQSSNLEKCKAMVEAMDTEIGRLLGALAAVDPDAYVVFLADNGTMSEACAPPFLPQHGKGSLFEGGVNVPLIVRGPTVAPGWSEALVNSTDVYATLAELGGATSTAEDAVSMVPYFTNPLLALRATAYAERFYGFDGTPPIEGHQRAVRDERYKLIRVAGLPDVLYDLRTDPFETTKIVQNLTPPQQAAKAKLIEVLAALGVD